MDDAKRQAITSCGTCGQPEDAHKHASGTDKGDIALFAALGGPCAKFVVSDASVIWQKHVAIVNNRAPQRKPGGPIGKRRPLCERCGNRGHRKEDCPL